MAAGIGGGVFGAYLGKILNLLVRCSVTAFFGSFMIIKGLNSYFGGLPDNLQTEITEKSNLFYFYGFLAIVLFLQGTRFQMKQMKAKGDDDYKYQQDETCC